MGPVELRDPDRARRFVTQSLWLARVVRPSAATVGPAVEWALAIADSGDPLSPVGFVADLVNLLLGTDRGSDARSGAVAETHLPPGLVRRYEDFVLGKLYVDRSVERAGDALRRLRGRELARGVAYVVGRVRDRARLGGVLLSPAVLKSLAEAPADETLARGWESLERGIDPLLPALYEDLIVGARLTADSLGTEDLFELEHGTAWADLGQRVALRQVLQTAASFEAETPPRPPRPRPDRRDVPTRLPDEDTYPVGGFASISTRGSVESLLHSQLAYMESAAAGRPDLFDVKFVRDELLYYSRDENSFLRRRRGFVFVLSSDLVRARFKDPELPAQRIVLVLGLLVALVRRLTTWLAADALAFEFVFLGDGDPSPLASELALIELIFREAVANGTVRLTRAPDVHAARHIVEECGRRSLCRAIFLSADATAFRSDLVEVDVLNVHNPRPAISADPADDGDRDLWHFWQRVLTGLANRWV
jgi:hypothetical protein